MIKRQILELEVDATLNVADLQTQISDLYRRQIVPLIDAYCSQITDSNTIHRIDRLEIDLGDIDLETLDADYVTKAADALTAQLVQQLSRSPIPSRQSAPTTHSPKAIQPVSTSQARLEIIQRFITTGQLPWWSEPLDPQGLIDCWDQLLSESPAQLKGMLQTALKSENVLQRILHQFSESLWMAILKLLAPDLQPGVQAYLSDVKRLFPVVPLWQPIAHQRLQSTLWQGLLMSLVLPPSSLRSTVKNPLENRVDALLQANLLHCAAQLNLDRRLLIQQIQTTIENPIKLGSPLISRLPQILAQFKLPETFSTTPISFNSQAPSVSSTLGDTELYIQNAGLALLWPFLSRFFSKLKLVESNQFSTLETAQRATLILQYLVDQSLISLESTLCFNKLLCGLDLSEPLPAQLTLAKEEKAECDALLLAIIQNWSALGSISIGGFRRAFLQRPGVLRSHHQGWILQVESQTRDILIDRLPWSFRVISLPWIEQSIYIEW